MQDEFSEARRLQRWGNVDRFLVTLALAAAVSLVVFIVWEIAKGEHHG